MTRKTSSLLAEERISYHAKRQENAFKHTVFNRYLMIRYSLALLFFSNLHWLVMQMLSPSYYLVVPLLLLVLLILPLSEQVKMYGTNIVYLKWTALFFRVQSMVQVVLMVLLAIGFDASRLFPLFSSGYLAQAVLIGLLLSGFLIALANLKRIKKIYRNEDSYYRHIQQLEKFI